MAGMERWLVAALTHCNRMDVALKIEQHISEANAFHDWEMNECFHGETRLPIGVKRCAWSAAGAVIARKSIEGHKLFYPQPYA